MSNIIKKSESSFIVFAITVFLSLIFMAMPAKAATTITAPANGTVYSKATKIKVNVTADDYVESNGTHYCNLLVYYLYPNGYQYENVLDTTTEYHSKGTKIEASFDASKEGEYWIFACNYYLKNGFKRLCGTMTGGYDAGYDADLVYSKCQWGLGVVSECNAYSSVSVKLNTDQTTEKEDSAVSQKTKSAKIVIKGNSKNVKASVLKKKNYSFNLKASPKGKVTFKKISGSKKLSISKAGKVTIKKKTKKGTYKIKVMARAKSAKSKYFYVTVKVR